MSALKIIFWISLAIIFYGYLGYGIILFCLITIKRLFVKPEHLTSQPFYPAVALIIPAYNEEDFIEEKIRNTLELEYPRNKLSIIFVTDGSTDKTKEIIGRFKEFKLLHQPRRKGKSAAMNRALEVVNEPVIIFSDANTLLNKQCIYKMVRHYSNPKVGAVAGEKKVLPARKTKAGSAGEGLYWKYESLLKKLDSEFYSVVGAAGELFSMRTHLYQNLEEETIIEDFVLSLRVCIKGYIVKYEPGAYTTETASNSIKDEQKRKVRISAGAFQAMGILKVLFNIYRYPVLSFQFISHRVLRWTLCPICLPLVCASNLLLIIFRASALYYIFFELQIIFYLLAITGWVFVNRNIKIGALYIPYYFLFMNFSVFLGFKRFLQKKQSVLWEKSHRHKPV